MPLKSRRLRLRKKKSSLRRNHRRKSSKRCLLRFRKRKRSSHLRHLLPQRFNRFKRSRSNLWRRKSNRRRRPGQRPRLRRHQRPFRHRRRSLRRPLRKLNLCPGQRLRHLRPRRPLRLRHLRRRHLSDGPSLVESGLSNHGRLSVLLFLSPARKSRRWLQPHRMKNGKPCSNWRRRGYGNRTGCPFNRRRDDRESHRARLSDKRRALRYARMEREAQRRHRGPPARRLRLTGA